MIDIASISALVAAIGVIVGVVFTVLELRNLVKTRQTELAISLYSQSSSKEMAEAVGKFMTTEYEDYNEFVKKYGPVLSEKPVPMAFYMVGMFFEGVGVLLHRKLVDIGIVADLFAVDIFWEKMKPLAEGLRKEFNNPSVYEWGEYLYNELKKREQQLATVK